MEDAIQESTALVSVMAANNEIGVTQPIRKIGQIAAKAAVFLHTDAAQALGKLPIDVIKWGVHLLSLSAHKAYGPKGVGALYVRGGSPRVRLAMQIHGGGHESERRSGTLPVPLIVGFGEACLMAVEDLAKGEAERLSALRDRLLDGLREIPECRVNGSLDQRLPNNLNVSFCDVPGESLLVGIHGVAVSSGSACTSASDAPSHVLRALGITTELSQASIRFGLGRYTTAEEIDYTVMRVREVVERLRAVRTRGARRGRRPQSREGPSR